MWLTYLIPDSSMLWALHGIVTFAVILYVGSFFAGPYKMIVAPIALMTGLFGVFMEGKYYGATDCRTKVAEMQQRVNEAEKQSQQTNTVIKTKIVERIKVVKETADANVQYVNKVVVKYDNLCTLSNAAVMLHNSASQNEVARSTGDTAGAASEVKASELIGAIVENYGTYYQVVEKLRGWQDWYRAQKTIFEQIK